MKSAQKVLSHIPWKIETFIKEDIRYRKLCTWDNNSSVPFKLGTLGPHTFLLILISCSVIFSWISLAIWNLFAFKGDFNFEKSQKLQGTKSVEGLSHLADLMLHQKTLHCCDEASSHQLPIAATFWMIQIISAEECSSVMQMMHIHYYTCSIILNACKGHTVHVPTQWHSPPPLTSTVKSSLFT